MIKEAFYIYIYLLFIKMSECRSFENSYLTYYQKNKDVVLSKANDYYRNNKDRLREQARDKYRNLPEK